MRGNEQCDVTLLRCPMRWFPIPMRGNESNVALFTEGLDIVSNPHNVTYHFSPT